MLIHGWPGSFYEFYKLIPLLAMKRKDNFSFEVICDLVIYDLGIGSIMCKEGIGAQSLQELWH